jgi:tetratricopeptide (TPR) repeat protein
MTYILLTNTNKNKLTDIIKKLNKASVLAGVILSMTFAVASVQKAEAQINTERVINVGRNAMYFEDYVLSIQYFNQAISAKPYLAQPYFYRSIAKLNLEDYKGAESDASKAIELNPFITDAWEVRGVARQNLGNEQGAIEDYAHALSLVPFNKQLMFNMAVAQTGVKDYAAADSTFSALLSQYPGYENGYLGRARLSLAKNDTIAAIADIDKALEIEPKSFNGHTMRADIAIHQGESNFPEAIKHMDEAIKLQPRMAGLYINRAFLKYSTNDWFGAMADYDYAIELEPTNKLALFNRGLLEMEVNANDKALADFNKVLSIDPDDVRARYNRAVIYNNKHQYNNAIADVNYVIEAFPDFPTGYYMRSDLYRQTGNLNAAIRDRDKAKAIGKKLRPTDGKVDSGKSTDSTSDNPEELVRREFASLLTVDDNTDFREEYNNSEIRGKVQDRNISIELEPMMELTFYSSPSEIRQNSYYIKEIDDLNSTRSLRFAVLVSNSIPTLQDSELIERHFKSIEYYNSYISTHTPRTIDYIGRALDFMTVHDYTSAIKDINRALELSPDYSPAYMLRAQAAARQLESAGVANDMPGGQIDAAQRNALERKAIDDIIADLDKTISLSPRNAFAWYNKGNMLTKRGDYTEAINAFSNALGIKSDLAEAYYNRGYLYLKIGNKQAGISDLSKAGELGVIAAYNLMKRISQ